jgi:chromate transporter
MDRTTPRAAWAVFLEFLHLGISSFGGPIAHLGYFRRAFVERLHWLDDATFAEIVALCNVLPGPTSSQVGILIGTLRARALGGLAAWLAFTTPSAVLLAAFAYGVPLLSGRASGIVHGLIVAAVAVVASAVLDMARTLCPDWVRRGLAVGCAAVVLSFDRTGVQLVAIALGAIAGLSLLRGPAPARALELDLGISRRIALACAGLFAIVLIATSFVSGGSVLAVFAAFFRTGSLVFGGGHVVLPLLQTQVVPRWIDSNRFLAGYGAAQAVPGPLFTFASYLGAVMRWPLAGPGGAALTTLAIYLPSFFLIAALAPFWREVRGSPTWAAALRGINAAVVGLLLAAFVNPVWINAIHAPLDVAVAALAFALLRFVHLPPWSIVAVCGAAGYLGA